MLPVTMQPIYLNCNTNITIYESLGPGNVYSMTKEIWIFRWLLGNRILNN